MFYTKGNIRIWVKSLCKMRKLKQSLRSYFHTIRFFRGRRNEDTDMDQSKVRTICITVEPV